MFSLLLVSLAVALIVLVLVALPHLQSGATVLSADGEERTRRGAGRLLAGVRIAFTVLGEAVGAGMGALRDGPASRRRRPVRQHEPGTVVPTGWTGPDEAGDDHAVVELPSSGAPRHAAR
jgi:hypothetical protein